MAEAAQRAEIKLLQQLQPLKDAGGPDRSLAGGHPVQAQVQRNAVAEFALQRPQAVVPGLGGRTYLLLLLLADDGGGVQTFGRAQVGQDEPEHVRNRHLELAGKDAALGFSGKWKGI